MAVNKFPADQITFGIEIECMIPNDAPLAVGHYHNGLQVAQLAAGWKAERDGSISATAGYTACELVSPVLVGPDGVKQVMAAFELLRSVGAKVNASCGFHVHVGFDPRKMDELGRLAAYVARFEKAIFASTGTKRREGAHWCKPIARPESELSQKFRDKKATDLRGIGDRYASLNLTNLAFGRRPTIEVRAFSGTLNVTKALGYVAMCVGLVQMSLESRRVVTWETCKLQRRKGEGSNALAHLFLCLGWSIQSRVSRGYVAVEGGPGLPAIKAELVRLAAKYDGPEGEAEAEAA